MGLRQVCGDHHPASTADGHATLKMSLLHSTSASVGAPRCVAQSALSSLRTPFVARSLLSSTADSRRPNVRLPTEGALPCPHSGDRASTDCSACHGPILTGDRAPGCG